ncbi:hypothetical protein [Opacimonas viscosa]|uniref:Uncharacterized protein n=1 Tax=Opacimonas viscosa TaxID=2961944 RepID=A0AA42BMC9_9ALTE|nr:hypothetical protein [Opacimonas viscosa]MCP3428497.1 hypothetical protein [Opacimonas viscosa]
MKSKVNFEKIKSSIISYINRIEVKKCEVNAFPFPLQEGQPGSFYGTCFAVLTAELMDFELQKSEHIKQALLTRLDNESGCFNNEEFDDEDFPNSRQHNQQYLYLQTAYFGRSALYALGCENLPPVNFAYELCKKGIVYEWLNELDWNNPWLVSNLDMFLGIFLLEWQVHKPECPFITNGLDDYFRWHDEQQSTSDGFWGSNTDPLERMAGGYHIFVIYDAINRKIPYLKQAAEVTKKLAWDDKLFVYGGGGGACEDMDAIDILVRAYLIDTNKSEIHKQELKNIAERIGFAINKDGGYGWRVRPSAKWIYSLIQNNDYKGLKGGIKTLLFKLKSRSQYNSIHLYSSCKFYPFKLGESDTWSTWFRASALAMIAKAVPEMFDDQCDWYLHKRPGLGVDIHVNNETTKTKTSF